MDQRQLRSQDQPANPHNPIPYQPWPWPELVLSPRIQSWISFKFGEISKRSIPVLTEACVSLRLDRVLDVGFVQHVLDAEQDLLDGDGWHPVLRLVQDGETHLGSDRLLVFFTITEPTCSRWVDVGVEQLGLKPHLWWGAGKVVLEHYLAFVHPSLPGSPFLPRNSKPELNEVLKPIKLHAYKTYSQSIRFIVPSSFILGLAMKLDGWSFRQHLRSSKIRASAMPFMVESCFLYLK